MTPTLAIPTTAIPATTPEPITDDFLMEILNPTEPAHTRMVASFHLAIGLRHITTLIAQGEHTNADWLADMRSSLAAIAEGLGWGR